MIFRNELLEQELQVFQEKSAIREKEWKISYEQANKLNCELQSENLKLMASQACNVLQVKLDTAMAENDELTISVRKLEQENDKLGQHNREIELWAKERMEQLDELLEKLAITETEMSDKTEDYKILVQRLKEENTELKQQIAVDLTQQNRCSSIVNSIELGTTFELSENNNSSFDDSPCVTVDDLQRTSKSELLKNLQQLTQRFEALEVALRRSKAAEQTINAMYDDALEKIAFLETELDATVRVLTVQSEAQLRTHREAQISKRHSKSMDRAYSSVKLSQEEEAKLLRNWVPANPGRHAEDSVKKGKEEEKQQQNFSGFLKRLQQGQATRWLRRKD